MHALGNLIQGRLGIWLELENALELLREGQFVGIHRPQKRASQTNPLAFGQKRFASSERGFSLRTLDRDAREMCNMSDDFLVVRRRAASLLLVDADSADHRSLPRANRRAPNCPQP